MERRIYRYLILITSIIVIATSLILTFLFYDIYIEEPIAQLSVRSLLFIMLPATIAILLSILVFLYFISSKLTSTILKPINQATREIESILSGDEVEGISSYKELEPFIVTIKNQKQEIENSITALKETEKYRRDFTANVTHELKTPLTSINGFAEMIASGIPNEEDTKKFARTIHKEGLRLLDLIESIINLSKIESQVEIREISNEPVDLYEIGLSTVTRLKNIAEERQVELNFIGIKTIVNVNKGMMEDLFSNLIDNAIKYNKINGRVDLNVYVEGKDAVIKVRDTGMGISKEEQSRIFERFYRIDKSRSKKISGTGIGLSIVKHIVEYYHGKIYLTSEKGQGTDIEIKLPLS